MRAGRSIIIIIIIIMEISTATIVLPHEAGDLLDPPGLSSGISINKLLPALFKCFGIILCGYVAGRAKIITSTHAKGLGHFVSTFALPALLFKNMVLLDFGNVVWPFIWSILVAKASVFAVVCVLTLLVSSPESRYSKAGLFSIFATQSNDFALGFPIVKALYQSTYPEYLQYIYLVAPVSLMLLNPIGFAFCEVQKWKNQGDHQQGKLLIVGQVALQVLKNPIVFMVIIGIAAHFVLRQTIPSFMSDFVDGLANSFEGAALFYLGLSMVGQLKNLTRSTVVTLILLLTAKLLLMPLICKDMVDLLDNTSPVNHSSLSNYAFLYGAFPTAPSVAIYAVYYNSQLEVIISGMVISTFLSAPIMFTSAWLLTLRWMDSRLLMNALQDVRFYISIASLVALLWTIAVMLFKKAFKRLPDRFTANLFLAQFVTCFGMILWKFVAEKDNFICQILTFTLLSTSLYSTYVWPAFIALSLVLLRRFDNLKVSPGWFIFASWGIPAFITAVLLICGEKMPDTIDSSVFYSKPQIICTTIVLSLSLLLGGSSLLFLGRGSWAQKDRSRGENTSVEDLVTETEQDSQSLFEPEARSEDLNTGQNENSSESTTCLVFRVDERHQNEHKQVARHVPLCLLLGVSLLANLCSSVWLLFHQHTGRLYVELQFFCAVANYGQGFLSFALFGLDKHLIILPFRKRLHLLWYGKKQGEQTQSDLPEEVRMTCTNFVKYHKVKCFHDIVRKRRCGMRTTVDCFLGCELVEWLQQAGLAQDQGEALLYGTRLQQGGILQHMEQEYAFQDGLLFYSFVT
ncbi:lysosomal cholesterol signaling protein [Nerophis lumbriciformis]|uniref:lysosomal cholesterol signaling protein n=1 Tax=Nerophis lumbriciformis TaxID=546530 RepID=UPI002ADEFF0B|nr:lysosomal cholesterol signaling protein-like [Nerophis lumbriciformis]XP_061827585.1 lysosomal cholesterol signaling protein-like [Nerophis lumbriciformis]